MFRTLARTFTGKKSLAVQHESDASVVASYDGLLPFDDELPESELEITENKSDKDSADGSKTGIKAGTALLAFVGFNARQDKRRRAHLIPKDKAAWLEYLLYIVKKKTTIEYLSDKELRKVIIRARPNLAGKKIIAKPDPDAPICINWTTEETAEWISECGFPYLKEAFLINHISGRRLIAMDCTALNKIGMTDLMEMRKVTEKIRELLDIPQPNILRALMRIPPFENYLKKKVSSGKTYDALTFEKFCKQEGFNYPLWKNNKNALIPCTCEVRILPLGVHDDDEDDGEESDAEDMSLLNAPTVEYVVRNLVIRDKTVYMIIEGLMNAVFLSKSPSKSITKEFATALDSAYGEIGEMTSQERLDFSTKVANALLDELRNTTDVLQDIQLLKRYIKAEITQDNVQFLRDRAEEFMQNVLPIASLMALGELDLESIFKQEPEFEEFVDSIIMEAEHTTNSRVPDALQFVDSVIRLAQERVFDIKMDEFGENVAVAKSIVQSVLEDVRKDVMETESQANFEEIDDDDEDDDEFESEEGKPKRNTKEQETMADFPNLSEHEMTVARASAEQIVSETLELALSLTNLGPQDPQAQKDVKEEMKRVTKGSLNAASAIASSNPMSENPSNAKELLINRKGFERKSQPHHHPLQAIQHEEYRKRYPSIPEEETEITRL